MKPRSMIILLAVVAVLATTGAAMAFKNEPPGFRGITWGTRIDDIKSDVVFYRADVSGWKAHLAATGPSVDSPKDKAGPPEDLISYYRKDDPLKIGEADLRSISYSFYKGRFFRVTVDYMELWNYRTLRKILIDLYGPGREQKEEYRSWLWPGRNLTVSLKYEMFKRGGSVIWTYRPIQDQKDKDFLREGRTGGEGF